MFTMTSGQKDGGKNGGAPAPSGELSANLQRVEQLSQRLIAALSRRKPHNPALEGPGQDLYLKTGAAMWAQMLSDPARIYEQQIGYWTRTVAQFVEAQQALTQDGFRAPEEDAPEDRRFANPLWKTNPYFHYVRRQYETNAEALRQAVSGIEGLEETDRRRLTHFTRQIIDLMSPTNFLGTNPDALERAAETGGESLIRGLENLVRDIEANDGDLLVSLADRQAFKVGDNIASTEGHVVFRNRMLELIRYAPRTETVHRVPLIIFPPWINKFYILDLRPESSLVRWIVEQGYTLFVVSWVNPDETYADAGLETYVEEGYLAALDEVKRQTGEAQVNAVGYCIAGTVLALTLALLRRRGDKSVRSATFLTTLTDFRDQGEFTVFLQNDFVDGIEAQVQADGILKAYFMSRTFSFLRANDLVYAPAIRRYMLGETPPAFDLLYWNGDGTNLPGRMAIDYLRGLCQQNRFAREGLTILGERLSLRDVTVPVCAVACETDHIAPWMASFDGIRQFGARSKTFILSQSGHIAGIINPPSKGKYGHYTSDAPVRDAGDWRAGAAFHGGSWWPRWGAWLSRRSGRRIPACDPGDYAPPSLCPAPGTYVHSGPKQ